MRLTGRDAYEQILAIVTSIDTKDTGTIDEDDLKVFCKKNYGTAVSAREVHEIIKSLDVNHLGAVPIDEFVTLVRHKARKNPRGTLKEVFRLALASRRESIQSTFRLEKSRKNLFAVKGPGAVEVLGKAYRVRLGSKKVERIYLQ